MNKKVLLELENDYVRLFLKENNLLTLKMHKCITALYDECQRQRLCSSVSTFYGYLINHHEKVHVSFYKIKVLLKFVDFPKEFIHLIINYELDVGPLMRLCYHYNLRNNNNKDLLKELLSHEVLPSNIYQAFVVAYREKSSVIGTRYVQNTNYYRALTTTLNRLNLLLLEPIAKIPLERTDETKKLIITVEHYLKQYKKKLLFQTKKKRKICFSCGKEFIDQSPNQIGKYCCKKCKTQYKNI